MCCYCFSPRGQRLSNHILRLMALLFSLALAGPVSCFIYSCIHLLLPPFTILWKNNYSNVYLFLYMCPFKSALFLCVCSKCINCCHRSYSVSYSFHVELYSKIYFCFCLSVCHSKVLQNSLYHSFITHISEGQPDGLLLFCIFTTGNWISCLFYF